MEPSCFRLQSLDLSHAPSDWQSSFYCLPLKGSVFLQLKCQIHRFMRYHCCLTALWIFYASCPLFFRNPYCVKSHYIYWPYLVNRFIFVSLSHQLYPRSTQHMLCCRACSRCLELHSYFSLPYREQRETA